MTAEAIGKAICLPAFMPDTPRRVSAVPRIYWLTGIPCSNFGGEESAASAKLSGGCHCERCRIAGWGLAQTIIVKELEMASVIPFQIAALPLEPFAAFFGLSDAELAKRGARRSVADKKPGFPCRVSLVDAEPGERVILLPFAHHAVDSPYQASGPIFVREQAKEATPAIGEVPDYLRQRLLSLRAYDEAGIMVDAEVAEGRDLEAHVDRFFADVRVAYLHVHNARPGCYSCRIDRAANV
jgi:hypothetical protein